ncbi:MAG TPA: glycosyltransferase family 10 [Cyclobacteriaceae bacterium]|nr:glycosyltransferase family 10 [Cyclobacteriaceae bacterium]
MKLFGLGLKNIKNYAHDYFESRNRIREIKRKNDFSTLTKVTITVKDNIFSHFIQAQTPGQLGVWKNSAFVTVLQPDINLAINAPNPYVRYSSDPEKNWLLHIEPPAYIQKSGLDSPEALKKFGRVYTSHPALIAMGGKFIASPPYVQWHIATGAYAGDKKPTHDYDFLASAEMPKKEIGLVAINSNMSQLSGHKLRADFITRVLESGVDIAMYGGSNWSKYKQYKGRAAEGKWEVYSPAKYVLVIENEVSDLYWSEKFTDAVLCYCTPIYYGSRKIGDYFPKGSYVALDINRDDAVDQLNEILRSDFFEKNIEHLTAARNLILTKHNMFNMISAEVEKLKA